MEKTDEKLASLIEKLQEAGFDYAPEVIDGAIRAMYYDGLVQLIAAATFATIFVISVVLVIFSLVKDNSDVGVLGIIGAVVCFILASTTLFIGNPWLLVFDSEAAFYQQLMSGIIK